MDWRFLPKKNKQLRGHQRIRILSLFFILFSALIILRLFDLQIFRGGFYAALASDQHEIFKKLFPERGSIYVLDDQDGKKVLYPLVTNHDLKSLYTVPVEIQDASTTAEKIFNILGLPEEVDLAKAEKELFADLSPDLDPILAEEIKKTRRDKWLEEQKKIEIDRLYLLLSKPDDPYEPLRVRLTDDQVKAIKDLNIAGLGFQDQTYRYYPDKGVGGHIFGFIGYEGDDLIGKYGLEGYYDKILTGKQGEIRSETDALGNIIAIGKHYLKEKEDGSSLVLTIDRAIQYKTCQELNDSVTKHKAKGGSAIVMDPKTGAILAMCSVPDYDPEKYYKVDDISVYNNPAIFEAYEPGSIFKPITMAGAIDAGKVEPNTTYVDTGEVVYDKYHIRNFADAVYGKQTMTQVLEFSINTGAIFAMRQMGLETFAKYVKDFGFGQPTGIELDKEMPGNIANLNLGKEIYGATATFGQGISVTPLQMVTAISAIANGGKLMKPYLVSQIIKGDKVENFQPQEVRQVISAKTSAMLSAMMVSVVENGHAKKAQIPGYRVAGKTGTAQVPGPNGGYKSGEINGSFVGFAPFDDPKFVMFVAVFEPVEGKLGETVAAPVFLNVAKFILQYYNVPYDKPDDPKLKK